MGGTIRSRFAGMLPSQELEERIARSSELQRVSFLIFERPRWKKTHPARKRIEAWARAELGAATAWARRAVVSTLCEDLRLERLAPKVWTELERDLRDIRRLIDRTEIRRARLALTDPATQQMFEDRLATLSTWLETTQGKIPEPHAGWRDSGRRIYASRRSGPFRMSRVAEEGIRAGAAYQITFALLWSLKLDFDWTSRLALRGVEVAGFRRAREVDHLYFGPEQKHIEEIAGRRLPRTIKRVVEPWHIHRSGRGGRPRSVHRVHARLHAVKTLLNECRVRPGQHTNEESHRIAANVERVLRKAGRRISKEEHDVLCRKIADGRSTLGSLTTFCVSLIEGRSVNTIRKVTRNLDDKPGK